MKREILAAFTLSAAILAWLLIIREPLSAPKLEGTSCKLAYLRLYGRRNIDMRVIFGYKDARPARFVADRYEKAIFISRLLEPCAPGQHACGFSRSRDNADLLLRDIPGPDGLPRTVQLTVANSSVGADDDGNHDDPFQKWQTNYAGHVFEEGIQHADVVFYDGHSRAGGGPDFEPPKIGDRKHVTYSWYKENQPGLKRMETALKSGNPSVELLGLFSCASDGLFTERLISEDSSLGVIASKQLIYFADALESLREALSAVLGMKCQPEFEQALIARSPQAGTELTGFFPGAN